MIKMQESDIPTALKGFETFSRTQSKDGKPYILSMEAGALRGPAKDQLGYTFVTKSSFASMEDMMFYESECAAHEEYKVFLRTHAPVEALMSMNFEAGVSFTL